MRFFNKETPEPRGKDSAPRISTPSELSIIAALYTTFAVVKFKPEKNSGLNGIPTHDTGAVLYQLSYQAICELVTFCACAHKVNGRRMRIIGRTSPFNTVLTFWRTLLLPN